MNRYLFLRSLAVLCTFSLLLSGCASRSVSTQINTEPMPSPAAAALSPPPSPSPSQPPHITPSPAPASTPSPTPYEGEEIVQFALQFDGYKYNYGGMDPSTGFDCSGLVFYVFRNFGYRLHRVAADQALNGSPVDNLEDLLPGDIICFSWYTRNYINHVGIYIGNDRFIHAMDSEHDVLISSLSEYLETHKWYGRRIIGSVEKKTEEQILAEEQQEAELMAWIAANTPENTEPPEPQYTPPPAYIPDPDQQSVEDAKKQHEEEIAQAWAEILGESAGSSETGEEYSVAEQSPADDSLPPPQSDIVFSYSEPYVEPAEPAAPDAALLGPAITVN